MKKNDIIRAWRDPKFRASLSDDQRAQLPSHPAAWMEDAALTTITGGCGATHTTGLCTGCPPIECY